MHDPDELHDSLASLELASSGGLEPLFGLDLASTKKYTGDRLNGTSLSG